MVKTSIVKVETESVQTDEIRRKFVWAFTISLLAKGCNDTTRSKSEGYIDRYRTLREAYEALQLILAIHGNYYISGCIERIDVGGLSGGDDFIETSKLTPREFLSIQKKEGWSFTYPNGQAKKRTKRKQ